MRAQQEQTASQSVVCRCFTLAAGLFLTHQHTLTLTHTQICLWEQAVFSQQQQTLSLRHAATWETPQIAAWFWRKHVLMWGGCHGSGVDSAGFCYENNRSRLSAANCHHLFWFEHDKSKFSSLLFVCFLKELSLLGKKRKDIAGGSHFTSLKGHLVSITTSSNLIDLSQRGRVGLQYPLLTMANNRTKWPACLHPQQQTTSTHQPSQSGTPGVPDDLGDTAPYFELPIFFATVYIAVNHGGCHGICCRCFVFPLYCLSNFVFETTAISVCFVIFTTHVSTSEHFHDYHCTARAHMSW